MARRRRQRGSRQDACGSRVSGRVGAFGWAILGAGTYLAVSVRRDPFHQAENLGHELLASLLVLLWVAKEGVEHARPPPDPFK